MQLTKKIKNKSKKEKSTYIVSTEILLTSKKGKKNQKEIHELIKLYNLKETTKTILNIKNRKEIYNLIQKKKLNITEISKNIKLSYKNTFLHIKKLEKVGLIKKETDQKVKGQETYIIPTKNKISDILKKIQKQYNSKIKQIQNKLNLNKKSNTI